MDALKLFQEYMGTGLIVLVPGESAVSVAHREKKIYPGDVSLCAVSIAACLFKSAGGEDRLSDGGWGNLLPDPVVVACDTGDCFRYGAALWKTRR